MKDPYRVLPHRDVLDCTMYDKNGNPIGPMRFEHRPCGMDLKESDVKDANWCGHCAKTINRAAQRRGQAEWK